MKNAVKLIGVTSICLMLTACGSSSAGNESGGKIVVGSFGGDYDEYLKDFVHPVFEESMPDTEIVISADNVNALVIKLQAEAGGPGTYDVAQLTMKTVSPVIDSGALEKLDTSKIPNWKNIIPVLKNEYCVPHIQTPISLITNVDAVDKPMTKWADYFGNDENLQSSGIWNNWYDYVFYPAAVYAAGGDPGNDWSVGYDDATHAAGMMSTYGSAEQNGQALIAGEINTMVGPKARGSQWADQSGQNIVSIVPEEGSMSYISYTCIPANSENKEAAYAYLNAELDPEPQRQFAENMFYAPTVTNVELSPELLKSVGVTEEEQSRLYPVEWDVMQEDLAEMRRLWDEAS